MDQELLSMPHVIAVFVRVFGMFEASGVSASDEVGRAAVCSGGCMPEDLGGASVEHWRGPDGKDSVGGVKSTVV